MRKNVMRCLALIMACAMPMYMTACTKADLDKTVSIIETNLPTAIQLALQIATVVGAFATPGPAASEQKVKRGLQFIQDTLLPAYDAHPSQQAFDQIVKAVNDVVSNSEELLLAAAQINDPTSKKEAIAIIGSLNAVLLIIDGAIQNTQSTATVKAIAQQRKVKLQQLHSLINQQLLQQKLSTYGYTTQQYFATETALGF